MEVKLSQSIKYFEIDEPYYALIAADDENKAVEVYIKGVADDDGTLKDSIKEVGRMYALALFCQNVGRNNPEITVEKAISDFEERKNDTLIIDGSLL
ncbi:hypothetical protein MOF28_15695 [Bacillus haynesii]|uniref:hypothetical protein n=1 Tax=Bacillus haynesii TaxID=1925021 RepID=UPI0022831511|nr:hypothetical protein [Bacillus haynesii]MCY9339799.1 hypothetical protein [Bacillus haynesii]